MLHISKIHWIRRAKLTLAAGLIGVTHMQAVAQGGQSPAPVDPGAQDLRLEEVMVTAERRTTLAQETPAAVVSIGGESLESFAMTKIEDLLQLTPGLNISASNSRNSMGLQLRGIMTATDPGGVDEAVSLFLDGFYLGKSTMTNMSLFDVERVEVLRGPQGTLWGRNVVGGAVNVITKDPSVDFEGEFEARLGNFDLVEVGGRLAGPLVADKLLGQITFQSKRSDGWLTNDVTGNKLYGTDVQAARGKLKWIPTDDIDVMLSLLAARDTSEGIGRNFLVNDPSPFFEFPQDLENHTLLATDGRYDNKALAAFVDMKWRLPGDLTLSALSGIFDYEGRLLDMSWLPADPVVGVTLQPDTLTDEWTVSNEVRLANDPAKRLSWQVGLYQYRNRATFSETWLLEAIPGTRFDAFFGINHSLYNLRLDSETDSYAGFGQVTYQLLDWLRVTAGTRYTNDKKRAFINNTGDPSPFHLDEPFSVSLNDRFDAWTPKVTVDALFKDTAGFDSLLLYATYAEGWQSGGFQQGSNAEAASNVFAPTEAKNYEFGIKAVAFDNRLNANVTFFHTQYSNLQVLVLGTVENSSVQTADSTIDGIELDMAARLSRYLDVQLGYAYYDGAYDEGVVLDDQLVEGNPLYMTPEHSATLGLKSRLPLGDWGDLLLDATYAYRGKSAPSFTTDLRDNFPELWKKTEQTFVDARIGLSHNGWDVSIWGRNLLDDRVLIFTQDFHTLWLYEPGDGKTSKLGTYREPRTYGVSVRWTF